MASRKRNKAGRFKKTTKRKCTTDQRVVIEHNYISSHLCEGKACAKDDCNLSNQEKFGKNVSLSSWKEGRRLIEFDVLLGNLKHCKYCKLGPIPLTYYNVIGELQRGLGGYLYVRCQNVECEKVNIVAYGSTYHEFNRTGMPCFTANTKLGTAMIDSLGGPDRVNNFLTTLNMKPIGFKNMKKMERRAGRHVEAVAEMSKKKAIQVAYEQEMSDIADLESQHSRQSIEMIVEDLGVGLLPGASPPPRFLMDTPSAVYSFSDDEEEVHINQPDVQSNPSSVPLGSPTVQSITPKSQQQPGTCSTPQTAAPPPLHHKRTKPANRLTGNARRVKLSTRFPCKTRKGISCAVDTAWQKRGFDSLTSHTFFMSKAKYGKKILKSIVLHRTCATCKWWRKNRPFDKIRKHRCMLNHIGSARMMESVSGVQGVKEFADSGVCVEYIEGDGDNTTIARVHKDLNITLRKRFDRNHIVKNVGKKLYELHSKNKKLSKTVIIHLQKCLKYAFAKNQGDRQGLEKNLKALVPHQFGDHSLCQPRFCNFKRNPTETYVHRSLPFKAALKDHSLRLELEVVFKHLVDNADKYADLGSSQQCEHANREVTMRAPKHLHYGNSESLDFRVQATSAFINEGRNYVAQVNEEAGLSPGVFTQKYADKQMKRRTRVQEKSALPSTKRRRLILKQERAITQAASEALEGQSYESGIGHEAEPDVEGLPLAVSRGSFKPVALPADRRPTFVMFDLETTDLIRGRLMPHLTQIAAVEPDSRSHFNCYVVPKVPISDSAQQTTGIVVSNTGNMIVNGEPVESFSITSAMNKFMNWLEGFHCVVLVAHNGRRFDFPVLMSTTASIDVTKRLIELAVGFIDSLPMFKKVFPNNSSYKQVDLVKTLLHAEYEAHNALADVEALSDLIIHANMTYNDKLKHSFTPTSVTDQLAFNTEKNKNLESLNPLVSQGVMKRATAENIAGSGLNLKHLRKISDRDGEDGLRNIFIAKNSANLPRVTNSKKILEEVIPKLSDYFRSQN